MELHLVLCCVYLHSDRRLDTHQCNGHSAPGSQGGRCTGRSLPSSDRCLADRSLADSDTHQYLWRRKEEEFSAREEVECSLRSLANICRRFGGQALSGTVLGLREKLRLWNTGAAEEGRVVYSCWFYEPGGRQGARFMSCLQVPSKISMHPFGISAICYFINFPFARRPCPKL